jgi:hypothetical protein
MQQDAYTNKKNKIKINKKTLQRSQKTEEIISILMATV